MAGSVIGIPGHSFGASLNISAHAVVGSRLNFTSQDSTRLTTLAKNASSGAIALATDPTVAAINSGSNLDQILTSNLEARGAVIGEIGL